MASTYVGLSSTLSVPAVGDDPPAAELVKPDGSTVDLSGFIAKLAAVDAGPKSAAVPARWQVVLPAFAEPGDYTVRIGDEEFPITVVQQSPDAAARKAAARAAQLAKKAGV